MPADQSAHEVGLTSKFSGLHRLEIDDHKGQTEMSWPAGQPVGIPAGPDSFPKFIGKYSLWFYVPANTPVVGGYADKATGKIMSAEGKLIYSFSDMKQPGYFEVKTPADTPQFMQLVNCNGQKLLLNVPPLLFRTPAEALIPAPERAN